MIKIKPKLRFKGFHGEWEAKKVGDISNRVTRKNSHLETDLPLTISAQYGLVDQKEFFDKVVASKNLKNYILLKNGEFAYNKSYSKDYPFGAIKRLNRYNQGALSTLYIAFKFKDNVSSNFMSYYYDSGKWNEEIYKISAEGARNHGLLNIAPTDFFNSKLYISKLIEEQQKIGAFFSKLDQLIDLQAHKIDQLQRLKRGYLQKLFPQPGEAVPRLRFKGFTDDWKEKKLGLSYHVVMGQSPKSSNYTSDTSEKILVQGNADIKNGMVKPRIYTKETTKESFKGNILFTVRAPVGEVAINQFDNLVIGRGVASIDGNYFLYSLLKKFQLMNYWNRLSSGSTFESVNSTDIKNSIIEIPSIDEQQKIGQFFKNIDQSIELQNKKLDELKQLKKAYLQKIFI